MDVLSLQVPLSICDVLRMAIFDSLCTLLFCEFRVRGPGLQALSLAAPAPCGGEARVQLRELPPL